MLKIDVLELKKRFTKEKVSFDNLAGCYVDASKNKVCTFNGSFLNLEEEEFFKYLEIAKKALSGSIGNQIMEYEFPATEEASGGKQNGLMILRDAYNDDNVLNAYYDHVIDTYEYTGNYLILVFHDNYDVVTKTKDKQKVDESEEVYQYLLIAICPVELDKPALRYNDDAKLMESRNRDWIVGAPATSVLFPAFTERSADIHSVAVISKNAKDSHQEFVENGLGCEPVKTIAEMREEFQSIIRSNFDNEEQANKAVLSATKDIYDAINSKCEESQRGDELNSSEIIDMLSDDNRFNEDIQKSIAEAYDKLENNLTADIIIDESLLKKNEDAVHILELEDSIVELNEKLNASELINTDVVDIKVPDSVSCDICVKIVDGKEYVCIPTSDVEVLVNNINIK